MSGCDARIAVRAATPGDAPQIAAMIRELAEYERLLDSCFVTPGALASQLFPAHGPARAECLVGEADGAVQGFALFFTNFSTFLCKPGIYLEDLYVRPAARGHGLGKLLLTRLAALAEERGCGRMEWSVLDWNQPAIGFYKSLGAVPMDEWTVFRLTGDSLRMAGASTP